MDEILKLAKECGFLGTNPNGVSPALEAFYKAAYNKGIEDAANHLNDYWYKTQTDCIKAIRELKK